MQMGTIMRLGFDWFAKSHNLVKGVPGFLQAAPRFRKYWLPELRNNITSYHGITMGQHSLSKPKPLFSISQQISMPPRVLTMLMRLFIYLYLLRRMMLFCSTSNSTASFIRSIQHLTWKASPPLTSYPLQRTFLSNPIKVLPNIPRSNRHHVEHAICFRHVHPRP